MLHQNGGDCESANAVQLRHVWQGALMLSILLHEIHRKSGGKTARILAYFGDFCKYHAPRLERVRQQSGCYFLGIEMVFREASCCLAMPFIIGGNLVESRYGFVHRSKPKHSFSLR